MKRKVIQLAGKTHVVSLPHKWVKRYNIKKGDEINLEEEGPEILISTEKSITLSKTEVNVKDGKFMRRFLEGPYREGYEEIIVNFSSKEDLRNIEESVNRLLGFEIMKQGKNYCVIKSVALQEEKEFDNVLRRTFLLIIEMSKDSLEALKSRDFEQMSHIKSLDPLINKFTNYNERLLHKRGFKDFKKTLFMYHTVCSLEQIADRYADICSVFFRNKNFSLKESAFIKFEETNIILKEFYDLFYSFNQENQFNLRRRKKALKQSLSEDIARKDETSLYMQLLRIIDIVSHMSMRTWKDLTLNK